MLEGLKKIADELKSFAMRGNVIDMAVGIIIGTAFGKIVDSMVKDIIMPPLGWILGKVDFTNLYIALPDTNGHFEQFSSLDAAKAAGVATINYGVFINTLISFMLIVVSVFIMIKAINKLKDIALRKEEVTEEATTKTCPKCFSTINIKATKCPCCTSDLE